jgi:hypothetical protein
MRAPSALRGSVAALLLLLVTSGIVLAQSARDRRRQALDRSTVVTESQAAELTLTVSTVERRPIQVWVRTGAVTHDLGRTLTAVVSEAEGAYVAAGQRVRAFPPESRSSMFQARVTSVAHEGGRVRIGARLSGPGRDGATRYVLEIVTETDDRLSVPNEAIIETGEAQLVYVQGAEGRYTPREIQIGIQGELYSEVLGGVAPGELVVTFGSFFIDAEHKLKGS